ncbi:hypothetical protein E2C01_037028 [Portunus trituberculatus]|uniref:Uncharacterized protein n=1 Tax=Portunus trituberculatus TaxID=210409 RepID=A0A5B7FE81_PORTR|nr:hypothetical protein [Portunus trituberculatus]
MEADFRIFPLLMLVTRKSTMFGDLKRWSESHGKVSTMWDMGNEMVTLERVKYASERNEMMQ